MSEYIDSNVLAYHLAGDRRFGPLARNYLLSVAGGERNACTSVYTFAELFATFRKMGLYPSVVLPQLERAMSFGISLTDLTQAIMVEVPAEMRRGLSLGDSIHYLSMKGSRVNRIVSEDRDWDRLRDIQRMSLSEILHVRSGGEP